MNEKDKNIHYINIFDHIYYIERDGVLLLSIEQVENGELEIATPKGVYRGKPEDIELIINDKVKKIAD